jgi:trigger factor
VAKEVGKEPSEHRDYVVELGGGRLADVIEDALPGTSEGETRTVELELDDGSKGTVEVTVKEIKEKVLPELDDRLAASLSEFETMAELRADIEARLQEQLDSELEVRFRQDALDAVVEKTTFEGIEPLVDRRAAALLESLARSLGRQGVSAGAYLQATGQTPEALQTSARAEAELAVKRELALEAVVADLGIEVADDEIEVLIREEAAAAGEDAETTVQAMRERGGFEQVRNDLALRKALDEIVARVKRIPMELAKAREKLWTPEKEKSGSGMKIWTPGSEEKP